MAVSTSSNLNITVAHAVSFLTGPLSQTYSATTLVKLQAVLEANLIALFAPSWSPKEPLRGSGRRCMTLSPECLPPRAIYNACLAAGVQWFDWIAVLGGCEFDFLVDPGCISIRLNKGSELKTVWSEQVRSAPVQPVPVISEAHIQAQLKIQADARARAYKKTLAQQILEDDLEEDEELFARIADEVAAPTWTTPVVDSFPTTFRSTSPISTHSRSSSRSSNSSTGFSFSSAETVDSHSSYSTSSRFSLSPSSKPFVPLAEQASAPKQSRRERARQARVYIDTTKIDVTPYDGGKTTVLTGGVMLGAKAVPAAPRAAARPPQVTNTWRSAIRA